MGGDGYSSCSPCGSTALASIIIPPSSPPTLSSPNQPPAVEKEEEMEDLKDRAQLRVMLWLGLEEDQNKWNEQGPGGVVAIFAETVR